MNNEEAADAQHRARAVAKLRGELTKDIDRAAAIAGTCGLWELLRLCYLLRLTRLVLLVPAYREKLTPADMAELQLREEALKYAIGLAAKHGTWVDDAAVIGTLDAFNNERVNALEHFARHINAKFEMEAMFHVARIRVVGERDQDCYFDLEAGLRDPQRSIYLHYGLRMERSTSRGKERLLAVPDLVRRLYEDFFELADLFEARCGISLDLFCKGILELYAALTARFQEAEAKIDIEGKGRINPDEIRAFLYLSRAMYFTDAELEDSLSPEFVSYLRAHPFNPVAASETELRFHYLTRRPFLMGRGFAVLSPELFFDSVLDNTHFTLLEGAESKAQYMDAGASRFLDRIAALAVNSGYEEVTRDVYLKQGKLDIGDIDLVLRNPVTNHTLLVEGKNHALPLPVYFRSAEAIDAHVARNRDWEKKVKRRIAHLHSASPSYTVDGPWDYIVVSLMPEPLAHLSDLLVLSLDEFEQWLIQEPRDASFSQFYENIYKPEEPTMSMEEMNRLQEGGYFLGKPAQGFPSGE
jgi:hypothetical protein